MRLQKQSREQAGRRERNPVFTKLTERGDRQDTGAWYDLKQDKQVGEENRGWGGPGMGGQGTWAPSLSQLRSRQSADR